METAEILHQFERATGRFARTAVEAAVARREEVTPELLRILEDTVDRAAQLDAEGDYMAHLYAMFLLAQFRETRAYPLVVRFASLPGDLLDSLCGDFITEDLGQVLASVCGGELAGIQSLIENEDADEWARGAALSSLVTLVAAGQKSRDEIVSYFASLFRGKLVRQWSHVWDTLVSYSSDLYPSYGRRSSILRRKWRRIHCRGRENRNTHLALRDWSGMESVPYDLYGGRQTVCRAGWCRRHFHFRSGSVNRGPCLDTLLTPRHGPYAETQPLALPAASHPAEPRPRLRCIGPIRCSVSVDFDPIGR